MIKIRIVIPSFNRKTYLKPLLDQILCQKIEGCDLRTVVVDDSSKDGTEDMLRWDYPEVTIVKGNGNWWFTRCINEGIRKALQDRPDFILTLNDDVELERSYLVSAEKPLTLCKLLTSL